MDGVYKLKGIVQHYTWGGSDFIPELLGLKNTDNLPFAEYWLGAHPSSPSMLSNGGEQSLYTIIEQEGAAVLGERVKNKFNSLPYLFKILDVRQMLSIQVHPSKQAAEEEYKRENEQGVALTASNRNYKDENHKPEMMAALSDFWLLHGFKREEELHTILTTVPALQFLEPVFAEGGYKGLYKAVMTMPQQRVNEALAPLMREIIPQYEAGSLQKSSEHFWAARAALTFCKNGEYDRGIFSVYLFNLLHLKEGEAIYQPAGLPHAYLEGQNVEVMANSDNVLRAGLTEKHVDVPELMKHVRFEPTAPVIIGASKKAEQSFDAPVDEFLLKRHEIKEVASFWAEGATILFAYHGEGIVSTGNKNINIKRGEAVIALAGNNVIVHPGDAPFLFFSVTTPTDKI